MHKRVLGMACLLGAMAVALGAFAAHGLKDKLDSRQLAIFETAVRYQFYHVFALLITGLLWAAYPGKALRNAALFFIVGICLFSGSLYLMTGLPAMGFPEYRWLGAITPFGGLCFIAGWLLLAYRIWRSH